RAHQPRLCGAGLPRPRQVALQLLARLEPTPPARVLDGDPRRRDPVAPRQRRHRRGHRLADARLHRAPVRGRLLHATPRVRRRMTPPRPPLAGVALFLVAFAAALLGACGSAAPDISVAAATPTTPAPPTSTATIGLSLEPTPPPGPVRLTLGFVGDL